MEDGSSERSNKGPELLYIWKFGRGPESLINSKKASRSSTFE